MDILDKFVEQSTIKISVMTIDGKRLTKSIFDQLENRNPFDSDFSFKAEKVFGYVNVKNESKLGFNKVIIFEHRGKLYKYNTLPIYILSISSLESRYKNLEPYLRYDKLFQDNIDEALKPQYTDIHNRNYTEPDHKKLEDVFNDEGKAMILRALMNAGDFMMELDRHQILI